MIFFTLDDTLIHKAFSTYDTKWGKFFSVAGVEMCRIYCLSAEFL